MAPIELHNGTSRIATIANSDQTAHPRAAQSGFAQFNCQNCLHQFYLAE